MIGRVLLAGLVVGGAAPAAPRVPGSDIAILIAVLVGFAASFGFVLIVAKYQSYRAKFPSRKTTAQPSPMMANILLRLKAWRQRAAQYLAAWKANREQAARQAKRAQAAQAAAPKGPRVGARALKDQLGRWPRVTHAPAGGYLIKASFASPRRAGWPSKIAVAAGIVIFLFALGHLDEILPGNRDNEGLRMVAALIGSMIAAWATRFIWAFLCRVRLEIRVQYGGATWTGPRGKRCLIKPDDDYEGIARPHHLGPEEIRVQNENIRRRVTKEKEKTKPAYQVSSEVLFRTGWSKHIEMPVAEIMPDISGRKAAALAAALDLALHESRKAVARAQAERMASAGRSSNNRRSDFDDE